MSRESTRLVRVGESLSIGGGSPISVQTMWKQPLVSGNVPMSDGSVGSGSGRAGGKATIGGSDAALGTYLEPLITTIYDLYAQGCNLLRFSVPSEREAEALVWLSSRSPIPLVADIHFDYTLALRCIEGGVPKVRINPGNIGSPQRVEEVIRAAKHRGTAIRVGVNGGSLPAKLRNLPDQAEAMVQAAEMELDILERLNFHHVVFSLKSSNVETTCRANQLFSTGYDYPLHLGVTEAGPLEQGLIKSGVAMGILLSQGIGDTIRVSLSDTMEREVVAGGNLLQALNLRKRGVEIISCPHCGRASFQKDRFLELLSVHTAQVETPLKVAVMGCIVNGPNEAKDADLGVTGSAHGDVVFFKYGKQVAITSAEEAESKFLELLKELITTSR